MRPPAAHRPGVAADGAQRHPLRRPPRPPARHRWRRGVSELDNDVRHPHQRGRRPRAGADEGRADEVRPAAELHRRGAARGRPARPRLAAGRRSADVAGRRGRVVRDELGADAGAGVPRLVARRRSPRRASGRCTAPSPTTAGGSPSRCSTRASTRRSRATSTTPRGCTAWPARSPSRDSTPRGSSTSCAPGCARSWTTRSKRQPDEMATYFDGHPFVRIPAVDPATSTRRVLTTRVGRRHRLRSVPSRAPTPTRGGAPARRSGASPSTPSTTSARSTAIPIPATTCSAATVR